jgi:HPt (histidine-containing phosphotransfer) domain-containing protein
VPDENRCSSEFTSLLLAGRVSLAKLAHTLRGSATNLGAHEMVGVCGELEALGQVGDISIVPSLVADLESQFNSVRDALLCEDVTG